MGNQRQRKVKQDLGTQYILKLVQDLPSWAFMLFEEEAVRLGMNEDMSIIISFNRKKRISEKLKSEFIVFVEKWVDKNPIWAFDIETQLCN